MTPPNQTPTFKENLAALPPIPFDPIDSIDLYRGGKQVGTIPNADGKRGSLQVYAHLLGFENGSLDAAAASKGLDLFAEVTADARANPGKHPNIDLLLEQTADAKPMRATINFKLPSDLIERVEYNFNLKTQNKLVENRAAARETFEEVMSLLEKGHVRTAQRYGDEWRAVPWVKRAIMLGFALGDSVSYGSNSDVRFVDKDTFPLRKILPFSGIRVVPPAAGLRRGSYAGKGTVFMSPGYANMGAYVGQNSMVEALVASCCQVGRDCHLSAGIVTGGVLDPIEATPVIIGDYVLMGEGSGVTQGTRLGDLVTLAPGVHISKATPVLDPETGVAYTARGTCALEKLEFGHGMLLLYKVGRLLSEKDGTYGPEVPFGSLVIPGVALGSNGTLKPLPLIAKRINSPAERAYALEEALRA